jgi:hypothetical protein
MKTSVAFEIRTPLSRSDLSGLCERLERLLRFEDAQVVQCEIGALEPNIVALEAIVRVKLVASRHNRQLSVSQIPHRLRLLIHLTGLASALLDESSHDVTRRAAQAPPPPGPGS